MKVRAPEKQKERKKNKKKEERYRIGRLTNTQHIISKVLYK